jgi:hypothetical protein
LLRKISLRSSAVDQFERLLWRRILRYQTIIAAISIKCCMSKGEKPKVCFVRLADLYATRSECPVPAILPRHHVVSQRRNSIQGVQLFGRGGAHSSGVAIVAIVAIVAVAGRRISFFELSLPHARVSASSLCDLRVT